MATASAMSETATQAESLPAKKPARLESLQALRGVAFFGIFIEHASHLAFGWGGIGVSIFFVLSGFLLMYNYYDRPLDTSLKSNLKFSIGKIKKVYHLHILTMLFMVVMNIVLILFQHGRAKAWLILAGKIGLNITLLQSWVPDVRIALSLNGVAWFLSAMLFLYFIFPFVRDFFKKCAMKKLVFLCVGLLVLHAILSLLVFVVFGGDGTIFENDGPNTYTWFTLYFPLSRTVDFFVGCTLARWFRDHPSINIDSIKASIIAVLLLLVSAFVAIWPKLDVDTVWLKSIHNFTTLSIPVAAAWVFFFMTKKDIVSKLCMNKVLVFLGNISAYCFLISNVITDIYNYEVIMFGVECFGLVRALIIVAEFAVSILLSLGYQKLHESWVLKQKEKQAALA